MNIAVYCGSNPGDNVAYAEAAQELGTWIGTHGNTLVYGGSSVGLMGIVSMACLEAGGEVRGVEPQFFIDAGVAQHNLTELFVVETMSERKAKMIELADVFVALPGGVGTLEEISEIMSRIRLNMTEGPCFLLNIDHFYDGLALLLDAMVDSDFMEQADRDQIMFPTSIHELLANLSTLQNNPPAKDKAPCVPESNMRAPLRG